MPRILEPAHQMLFKLVLFGPSGSGRATNLRFLEQHLGVREKGRLTTIQLGADATLLFEFLLPDSDLTGGFKARFQLFSTAGRTCYRATHDLLLRNADGVVLVIDSDQSRVQEHRSMIEELAVYLESRTRPAPAFVVQLNKRDLDTAMSVEDLKQALEIPPELPVFEASAISGAGVIETFNPLCQAVMAPFQSRSTQNAGLNKADN